MAERLQPAPLAAQTAAAVGTSTEEESRAFLQQRLALMGKVGCIICGCFLLVAPTMVLLFQEPSRALDYTARATWWFHFGATALFGMLWALGRHARLPGRTLAVLDSTVTLGSAVLLSLNGVSMRTGIFGVFQSILAIGCTLVLRAIAVPSSGRRTLAISVAATLLSLAATGIGLAAWPSELGLVPEVAPPGRMVNMAIWLASTTALATIASRVIYGLRREVHEARRIGQYVLTEKLGEGAMGVVYAATHAMLRRRTAIKLLPPGRVDPETLARFEREVCLTARLSHPNTVAIYDYGRTPDGVFYYAMEYLDGLDLRELVEATGPVPPGRVVHVLEQVCASLAEAHEAGLVHRDVKPANIVLAERGGTPDVVKVLDFGLVKDVRRDEGVALTAANMVTGTPLYLSPEAIVTPGKVGPASDLYAVGAVGYYLLTGTHAFDGKTVMQVCAAHLHVEPQPPSVRLGRPLPTDLETLLLQALAKHPEERPASARAFRAALLACRAVPPWTEEEASAWWAATGTPLIRRRAERRVAEDSSCASTVAVDLAKR